MIRDQHTLNLISLPSTNKEHAETEIKNTMPFTVAPKKMKYFDTPLYPLQVSHSLQPPATAHLLAVGVCLCLSWEFHINGIMPYVVFCAWLLSLPLFPGGFYIVA